ncbi:hypothetical protein N7454_010529 [Penicillium verhagenii]|nr:hypothetical protein N7454_010529 [Penicillium verhagenii]
MYILGYLVNICLLILPLAVTIGTLAGIDAHRRTLGEGSIFKKGSYSKRAYNSQTSSSPTHAADFAQAQYSHIPTQNQPWEATVEFLR